MSYTYSQAFNTTFIQGVYTDTQYKYLVTYLPVHTLRINMLICACHTHHVNHASVW